MEVEVVYTDRVVKTYIYVKKVVILPQCPAGMMLIYEDGRRMTIPWAGVLCCTEFPNKEADDVVLG